jgi:hypothetical protein
MADSGAGEVRTLRLRLLKSRMCCALPRQKLSDGDLEAHSRVKKERDRKFGMSSSRRSSEIGRNYRNKFPANAFVSAGGKPLRRKDFTSRNAPLSRVKSRTEGLTTHSPLCLPPADHPSGR